MSLLRVLGYGVTLSAALSGFGWALHGSVSTTLGLLASGVLLTSAPRLAVPPERG